MSETRVTSRHTAQPYGEVDRVIVFAQMLEAAMQLLAAETLAKDRLALIAVDNLADLLLHRHADRVFDSGEGSWAFPRRQFSRRERHRIRKNFAAMLRLAQARADAPWGRDVDPILSEDDAKIVRVAHAYRNGVYHDDRHNQAVLSPLAVLYAQAIGRAFVGGYRPGDAWSVSQAQADALARLGFAPQPDDFTAQPMFEFHRGVASIVDRLVGGWEVAFGDFRAHLSADISDRALAAARVVVAVIEAGMPEEEVERVFWWSQFWDEHGSDDELQQLDRERIDLAQAPESGAPSDDTIDSAGQAEQAYLAHLRSLRQAFTPGIDLGEIPRFEKRAESLARATTMSTLLDRYERLDAEVEALEKAARACVDARQHVG